MSPEEIDRAIDALPDHELEELYSAAATHVIVRASNVVMIVAISASLFALYFAARTLITSYWPGSLVAAAFATLFWCGALFGFLRLALCARVARWRIRWAARREYRSRSGAA